MHRSFLLTTVIVALAPAPLSAQYLSLGLRAGASFSTMSLPGSGSPAGRTSALAGTTAVLWVSDGLALRFDALYAGKGFSENAATGVTTSLALSYLEVPLVAAVSLPGVRSGGFQAQVLGGAAFAFRVRCTVTQGTGDVTGITDCNPDNVSTFDVGVVAGAGLKIGRGRGGLILDATYTFALLDANLNEGLTARNRAVMISAGFLFPIS